MRTTSNRPDHNRLTKLLLPYVDDKKIDRVNKTIDLPSAFLGSSHRRLYHSSRDHMLLALMETDPEVFLIAQCHLLLDQNKNLQKLMEFL